MNKKFDIIVVGAGPAGLMSAHLCIKQGFSVKVIEEHNEIGLPVQCSGLISSNLSRLVKIENSYVEHKVRGALLHAGKQTLKLEKKGTAAYVINRHEFDKTLAEPIRNIISMEERVRAISINKNNASVITSKGRYEASVVLGCDGPNSLVRNSFGERPQERVTGLIAITREKNRSPYVEMWYDKRLAPDGFLWKIARGEKTEYGMFSSKPRFQTLESFFGIKRYEKGGGLIPFGFHKTYFDRTLLIGDAASQVKPWSGGGVIYSLTAARIAAKVIAEAFSRNDFSEDFLRKYEKQWHRKFGINIAAGILFRKAYRRMGQKQIETLFRLAGKFRKRNSLDMDFPLPGFLGTLL